MATYLYRVGRWSYSHRFTVIGIWLLLLVGAGVAGSTLAGPSSSGFSIPGIPSEKAQTSMTKNFPQKGKFTESIAVRYVVKAPAGTTLTDPKNQAAINTLVASMKAFDGVKAPASIANPFETFGTATTPQKALTDSETFQRDTFGSTPDQARTAATALSPISADGTTAQISAVFSATAPSDVTSKAHTQMQAAADAGRAQGLTVEMSGQALPMPTFGGSAEIIGIAVAIVVLIITFASLVAWGMPILTALIGLAIGVMGVSAASGFISISAETPILATMVGLAVGIDYALFIVSRYRHELLEAPNRAEAAGRAVGTAGSAVVFAGLTVIIALAALAVVNIPFLTAMGLAAAFTVAIAVIVALTLLPAILGLFGSKAFAGRIHKLNAPDTGDRPTGAQRSSNGRRWITLVTKRPAVSLLLSVVVLGIVASPLLGLKLALPDDGTSDPSTTQRRAYDLVASSFGPGVNGPMIVVAETTGVSGDRNARISAIGATVAEISALPDVKSAVINQGDLNADASAAVITVVPESGPSASKTTTLVKDLRSTESATSKRLGVSYGVTGQTAIQIDVSDRLLGSLVPYLSIVVGLAFILLVLVFRSILVPLSAALGFLLSIVATFGATVAIFQRGDLGLVSNPQPIISFLPIFLIGIVFGLAMDYQVFLVTRMREEYVHGRSAKEAVLVGFTHSARVVAAAATIMISVFAAFMLTDNSLIQSMGFALAAAVFFDAFIIRMIVIPSALAVLGDKAWWLPKWLDRILPNVDVEGDKLGRYLAAQAAADSASQDPDRTTISV